MAYLRPLATKEGKQERSIIVVMLQVKARGEADSGARSITVQTRFTMLRERLRAITPSCVPHVSLTTRHRSIVINCGVWKRIVDQEDLGTVVGGMTVIQPLEGA